MTRKRVKAKLIIAPNPILTQVCKPVEDGEDVSGIIRDMMHILTNSKHGVGLAAPQAGHLKRIILVKTEKWGVIEMINPVIRDGSIDMRSGWESCLSYPGKSKQIKRYKWLKIEYIDDSVEIVTERFSGMEARIIRHEIDHLNGKCKVGE
jgi:peptide deformylase